jgi:gas vesicle protein
MNNAGKIMIGFLLGSMIGVATGLLVAPTTGKRARKKIGKKSKKIAKQIAGYIGMEEKFREVTSKRKNGRLPVEA